MDDDIYINHYPFNPERKELSYEKVPALEWLIRDYLEIGRDEEYKMMLFAKLEDLLIQSLKELRQIVKYQPNKRQTLWKLYAELQNKLKRLDFDNKEVNISISGNHYFGGLRD